MVEIHSHFYVKVLFISKLMYYTMSSLTHSKGHINTMTLSFKILAQCYFVEFRTTFTNRYSLLRNLFPKRLNWYARLEIRVIPFHHQDTNV